MKLIHKLCAAALLFLAALPAIFGGVETYPFDPVHSMVALKIRHVVSRVPGQFTKVAGTIHYDRENPTQSSVQATIEANSLSTNAEKRDNHVKSDAFLDVARFPTITFVSRGEWKKTGPDAYEVPGDLTMHGITHPVALQVSLLGFGTTPAGKHLAGWEAKATVRKSEFGVNGPAVLSAALGDDVEVNINIEAILDVPKENHE